MKKMLKKFLVSALTLSMVMCMGVTPAMADSSGSQDDNDVQIEQTVDSEDEADKADEKDDDSDKSESKKSSKKDSDKSDDEDSDKEDSDEDSDSKSSGKEDSDEDSDSKSSEKEDADEDSDKEDSKEDSDKEDSDEDSDSKSSDKEDAAVKEEDKSSDQTKETVKEAEKKSETAGESEAQEESLLEEEEEENEKLDSAYDPLDVSTELELRKALEGRKGDVINLTADIRVHTNTIYIDKGTEENPLNFVLNLQGHTLTLDTESIEVRQYSSLTINGNGLDTSKISSLGGSDEFSSSLITQQYTKLTLNDLTYEGICGIKICGSASINNSTIKTDSYKTFFIDIEDEDEEFTLKNCTVKNSLAETNSMPGGYLFEVSTKEKGMIYIESGNFITATSNNINRKGVYDPCFLISDEEFQDVKPIDTVELSGGTYTSNTVVTDGDKPQNDTLTLSDIVEFYHGVHFNSIDDPNDQTYTVVEAHVCDGGLENHKYKKFVEKITSEGGELGSFNYYLPDDVEIEKGLVVGEGKTVNLCLNGYKLSSKDEQVITVENGGTLNIYDCSGNNRGTMTVTGYGRGIKIEAGGNVTLYRGVISGCQVREKDGAGVYNEGTFTMNGGEITACYATGGNGGGVYIAGAASFTMNDGCIYSNESEYQSGAGGHGGGVCVYRSSQSQEAAFTMNGGSIQHNEASKGGGGVYNCSTFNLKGGSITQNTSTSYENYGGGILTEGYYSNMTISGKVTVKGNTYSDFTEDNLRFGNAGTGTASAVIDKEDGLDLSSKIGVSMKSPGAAIFITDNANDDNMNCFFTDNSKRNYDEGTGKYYHIVRDGSTLKLVTGTLSIDKSNCTIYVDDTSCEVNATADGNSDKYIQWVSSDSTIADLNTSDQYTCKITPKKAGTFRITATLYADASYTNKLDGPLTCTVTVEKRENNLMLEDADIEKDLKDITKTYGEDITLPDVYQATNVNNQAGASYTPEPLQPTITNDDPDGRIPGLEQNSDKHWIITNADAGTYTVTWTSGSNDIYVGESKSIKVTVNKKELTPYVASVESKVYDGTVTATGALGLEGAVYDQKPEAEGIIRWTSSDAGTTTVNVYRITLGNTDTGNWGDNYKLSRTKLEEVLAPDKATITKAPVDLPQAKTGLTYTGKEQTGVALAGNGLYTLTGNTGKDAGTYKAVASLADQNNYEWSGKATSADQNITWSIAKAKVAKPAEDKTAYTYNGKSQTYKLAAAAGYTVSGAQRTEAGSQKVTITLDKNYTWTDGTTAAVTYTFTIAKAKVECITGISLLTYNGKGQTGVVIPSGTTLYTISGNTAKYAGSYTAVVSLKDKNNYEWKDTNNSKDQNVSWSIAAKTITVKAKNKTSLEGSQLKTLTFKAAGIVGSDVLSGSLSTSAKASKPGTYDITQGSLSGGSNYNIVFTSGTYTVKASKRFIAKGKAGDKKITLTWDQCAGADGYDIYYHTCKGKNTGYKLLTSTTKLSCTAEKLNNKEVYKFYVQAYKMVKGKKVNIRKTPTAYVAMKNSAYTNVKKITVSKNSYTVKLSSKKKVTIKASVKVADKSKKPVCHVDQIRYFTTNSDVARVNSKGVIKAAGKGTCTIYVLAPNGLYKKVKVTVK